MLQLVVHGLTAWSFHNISAIRSSFPSATLLTDSIDRIAMVAVALLAAFISHGNLRAQTSCTPGFLARLRGTISYNEGSCRAAPARQRFWMQDFSSSAYWDKVYAEDPTAQSTEWHLDGEALIEPLEKLLGPPTDDRAILNVGCGTSSLWSRIYDRGWRNITNIDFSETCIEHGRPKSADKPEVQWFVMDACNLAFQDDTFDAAVDKGTLDAIACSEGFDWLLPRMACSLARVLRPGGTWVCVSITPPDLVLPLLECSNWYVEVERLHSFWMYVGRTTLEEVENRAESIH